jgi:hypothetical protein
MQAEFIKNIERNMAANTAIITHSNQLISTYNNWMKLITKASLVFSPEATG